MNKLKHLPIIFVSILIFFAISAGAVVKPKHKDLSIVKYEVILPPSSKHKTAIDHCVSIVQKTWVSKIPAKVLFIFNGDKFESGTVGMTLPLGSIEMGAYKYPATLGKSMFSNLDEMDTAIAKNQITFNESRHDMIVELSKKEDWYTGIDGKTSKGKPDLVTLCLHEVYHGLMFYGSRFTINNKGHVFAVSKNDRFDSFVVTKTTDGKFCSLTSFYNSPEKLAKAVTNNKLYFAIEDRRIAKLHAPYKFKEGKSIHHLDENKYMYMKNRLMTPDFRTGRPTHQIGPIVEEIQKILRNKGSKRPQVCDSSAVPVEPRAPLSVIWIVVISVSAVFASTGFGILIWSCARRRALVASQ